MDAKTIPQNRPIITRAQAKALGLKRYFTGQPCSKGHVDERRVDGRRCFQCARDDYARYYAQNREKVRETYRLWEKDNIEKVRERTRLWRLRHPKAREYERGKYHRRRARKLNAAGSFSPEDIVEISKLQRNRCARCRKPLKGKKVHVDHIVPLALGGCNDRRNLQLLCGSCNCAKGARDPIEDMRRLGHLL